MGVSAVLLSIIAVTVAIFEANIAREHLYQMTDKHARLRFIPVGIGKHFEPFRPTISVFGSSPWARGTLKVAQIKQQLSRFIPVGTGNTRNLLAPRV